MKKALKYLFVSAVLTCMIPCSVMASELARGVSQETTDMRAEVAIDGTKIEFQATVAMKFEVFSITGQLIKVINVVPGQPVSIELSKGFYIIKCEAWTRRVMLK